ncbi:hypothetical protein PsorP6_011988 [Peronosclerospora sorghi]|uniref:Uncharacterized protein n=1 Tax=Peronosclerospora sorghi TaxID=230839 RepID=A0ACC0WM32_9STRA|nr:hypothetical protein PsorP6_011988 [Peronosclerospora sorghi]
MRPFSLKQVLLAILLGSCGPVSAATSSPKSIAFNSTGYRIPKVHPEERMEVNIDPKLPHLVKSLVGATSKAYNAKVAAWARFKSDLERIPDDELPQHLKDLLLAANGKMTKRALYALLDHGLRADGLSNMFDLRRRMREQDFAEGNDVAHRLIQTMRYLERNNMRESDESMAAIDELPDVDEDIRLPSND